MFLVNLIEVTETKNNKARLNLYANCTHVGNDYWLYEGDVCALNEGISFYDYGDQAIESYGDLTGSEIKKMVIEAYGIDKCFLS